jgi:hypothetical protein
MATPGAYFDRLSNLVDTLEKFNDDDSETIVNELLKSHIAMKQAVEMDQYTRKMDERKEIKSSSRLKGTQALDLLDQLPAFASETKTRSRLTDQEGDLLTGAPQKLIGKGGIIDTDYFEFSVGRGGGLMFDGARRRNDADKYLTAHEGQIYQVVQTVNQVNDAKWALGADHPRVVAMEEKLLNERNHIVNSRNALTQIDTYANADGYNPIGNAIMRSGEVKILERYDTLIEQYDSALDVIGQK